MVTFAVTFLLTIALDSPLCILMLVPEPCLDSFVFLRVKERQENILVEPETEDQRFANISLDVLLFRHPVGDSVAFLHSLTFFCIDTKLIKSPLCLFYQRVCRGSRRGLSTPNALSNYSSTCVKWSCAVDMNAKVSTSEP